MAANLKVDSQAHSDSVNYEPIHTPTLFLKVIKFLEINKITRTSYS